MNDPASNPDPQVPVLAYQNPRLDDDPAVAGIALKKLDDRIGVVIMFCLLPLIVGLATSAFAIASLIEGSSLKSLNHLWLAAVAIGPTFATVLLCFASCQLVKSTHAPVLATIGICINLIYALGMNLPLAFSSIFSVMLAIYSFFWTMACILALISAAQCLQARNRHTEPNSV